MGQRFRLKADFDTADFSAEIRVILNSLKKYGMFLADNGSAWFISALLIPGGTITSCMRVSQVKGSDFEAVDESSLMIDKDSGRARQP